MGKNNLFNYETLVHATAGAAVSKYPYSFIIIYIHIIYVYIFIKNLFSREVLLLLHVFILWIYLSFECKVSFDNIPFNLNKIIFDCS